MVAYFKIPEDLIWALSIQEFCSYEIHKEMLTAYSVHHSQSMQLIQKHIDPLDIPAGKK